MNSQTPKSPTPDPEARLTALLLGELPAAETEALRTELATNVELAKLYRRLSLALDLTRATVRTPEPKELTQSEPLHLSPDRRAALLAQFRKPPTNLVPMPRSQPAPRFDRRELLMVAAMLAAVLVAAGILLPSLATAKTKGMSSHARRTPETEEFMIAAREPAARVMELSRGEVKAGEPGSGGEVNRPANDSLTPPQAVPYQMDPVLARRYGLIPRKADVQADTATIASNADRAPVTLNGDSLATGALPREVPKNQIVNRAMAAPDGLGTTSLASKPDSGQDGDGAAGRRRSNFDVLADSGRERGLNPNEIALPAAEPPLARDSGVVQSRALWDENTPTPQGPAIGVIGGMTMEAAHLNFSPAQNSGGKAVDDLSARGFSANQPARLNEKPGALPEETANTFGRGEQLNRRVLSAASSSPAPAPAAGVAGTTTQGTAKDSLPAAPEKRFGDEIASFYFRPVPTQQEVEQLGQIDFKKQADPQRLQVALGIELAQPQWATRETLNFSSSNGRTASPQADLATNDSLKLGRGEKLAELELGQSVAEAEKPATTAGYPLAATTGTPPPVLGDLPVMGRMFKRNTGNENTTSVQDYTVTGTSEVRPNELPRLLQERNKMLSALAQSEVASNGSKEPSVEVLNEALATSDEKPTLLSKLKRSLGGDVTRTTRVKIERETPDVALFSSVERAPAYDPYFLTTEFEVVRSSEVLGRAAEALGWTAPSSEAEAKEAAIKKLQNLVAVNQNRGTRIVEINARSEAPEKAAQIANAVAKAYQDYRNEQTANRNSRAVKTAKDTLVRLNQQIDALQGEDGRPQVKLEALQADTPLPQLAPGAPEPQAEVATADNAFSTFSLNVSDVSFKLAAASLDQGQMPEPATVRTEEFINAFDYRDPEPTGAAPIAFTWERARYPFAHDRDLIRFSVKTAASGRPPGRPLNLVLLLDNSGSMERADRVRIRQECLRVLAGQLEPQDRVSVVAFARTPRLWVDGLPGTQAAELPGRVGELTPDGGTNLEEALRLAYQTAARHFAANGINRVVLLTDGAANLGDVQPDSLKAQVGSNRQQGIALDCFGIGWEGFNDELLEVLSRHGDGRYGFVNSPEAATSEFAAQLVGALQIAAADVKVQVEWNPRRVTAYRQLGYAKHQLTKEQFRDNSVDAAEIGAAEAGNALYLVQVNPAGEGPLGTVRVRFKVPGTDDYREHEWPLSYDGISRPLEQSGPALRLAATASAFSEWLVSSPYAAEVTPDSLLGLLNGVADTYAADPRPKQFEQMLHQAKSLSGQ